MTSLRMRLVEAGARKICYERDDPSELTEYPYGCRACVVLSEETLDAMLDVLTENADEDDLDLIDGRSADPLENLLAVLREDR